MTTVELVKQYYANFNNKNYDLMLKVLHPEIRHEVNQGPVRVGKDHFSNFLKHMDQCYEETLKDQIFMVSGCGTRVACEFVVHGKYKETDKGLPEARGQKYIIPAGTFFEVRYNQICRITTYYNLPAWIEMVKK